MKKKLLVLLSSVIAGVGLVGATFASWAVTDNADPLGVKISPSTIAEDNYNTMVLEWGDKTTFKNIGGLGLGESSAQTISIEVKSTSTDEDYIGGNLSISLEDRTDRTGETGSPKRLINYLAVRPYYKTTDPVADVPLAHLNLGGSTLSANDDIETPQDGTALRIYFKVYIDSTGLDAAGYAEMKSDIVYLTANWDRPSTIGDEDLVTETLTDVYYYDTDHVPHIYAWNSTTLVPNTSYPGIAMTPVEGHAGYYSYALKSTFDRVIFTDGNEGDEHKLSGNTDVTVPSTVESTPLYDASTHAWKALPDFNNVEYWLIGSMNEWESGTTGYKFTVDPSNNKRYTLTVTTTAQNQEMKVIDNTGMKYWGGTTKGTSTSTQVFVLGDIGEYTLEFYPDGHGTEPTVYLGVAA